MSLGFRCGECQLNNCKAQRLIVQKQVSKFKTLKIRTRPVPSPLPEANPGKVPSQHFAQISYRILRTLQSSKATLLRNFRRRDGAALGSSDPLHSEEVTMSLVQPFNHGIFGGSEHHFFCSCGTSFVIVIIDIHQEQPDSLVASSVFCATSAIQKLCSD